ncbi:MAG: hypothetical protein AAGE94_24250 [Acidobacteriota bacterium]
MKLRALLAVLFVALVTLTGVAVAVDTETPAPIEQPAVDEAQPDALPSVLPELRPELTEANPACCIADCYSEFDLCTQGCAGSQACLQDCREDLQACRLGC